MELRLGFRITLVLVILALTLSNERVEAQRAGKMITAKCLDIKSIVELILTVCN